MKKLILTFSIFGLMICSCDKNEQTTTVEAIPDSNLHNSLEKDFVTPQDCKCPRSFQSCYAECLFSSVCICWDPLIQEGACGCYFGIARAEIKPKTLTSAPTMVESNEPGVATNILINTLSFDTFLNFTDSIRIKTGKLRAVYREILRTAVQFDKIGKANIPGNEYGKLFKEYDKFLNSLGANEKKVVINYIEKKSREAGLH